MSQIHEANNHEGTKENHSIMYYNILSKISNQINWLTFVILIIVGTSIFVLYTWHFGNLKYAIKVENYIVNHPEEVLKTISPEIFQKDPKEMIDQNIQDDIREKEDDIKNKAQQLVNEFKSMAAECRIAFLQFAGVKVFITDFLILLSIVGTLFLVWLFFLFKYSRNTMAELFNFPSQKTSVQELGISSLFFVITHGFGKKRYTTIFEMLAGFLLILTSLELISNFWDLFFHMTEYGIKGLYNLPGFKEFLPHAIVSTSLILICLATISVIIRKTKVIVLDIHNLIILLRWGRIAIIPTLFELTERNLNQKLERGYNSIEYIFSEEKKSYILMTTLAIAETTSSSRQSLVIESRINLRKSLAQYLKNNSCVNNKNSYIDKYLNRRLMKNELEMREYFFTIFTDRNLEKELAAKFKIFEEKLNDKTFHSVRRRIFSKNRRGLRQRLK